MNKEKKFRDEETIEEFKKIVKQFFSQYFHPDNISWIESIAAFDIISPILTIRLHSSGKEFCGSNEKYGYRFTSSIGLNRYLKKDLLSINKGSDKKDWKKALNIHLKELQNHIEFFNQPLNSKIFEYFTIYGGNDPHQDEDYVTFEATKELADKILLIYRTKIDESVGMKETKEYEIIDKKSVLTGTKYIETLLK